MNLSRSYFSWKKTGETCNTARLPIYLTIYKKNSTLDAIIGPSQLKVLLSHFYLFSLKKKIK